MSVSPAKVARKLDGSFAITAGGDVTIFDHEFTRLSALPSTITPSNGTGASIVFVPASSTPPVGFMRMLTGTSGINASATAAEVPVNSGSFSYLWMRALLRISNTQKPDSTVFGLYDNASAGASWYQVSGEFIPFNSGDTPYQAGQIYTMNTRWAYRDIGMLLIPSRKLVAITEGNNIINAGAWTTYQDGSVFPRIACRHTLLAAARLDVLRWRLTAGLL